MLNLPKNVLDSGSVQRLAVKLISQGERSVIKGHPWIFSNSIVKVNKEGRAGDICIIFSKNKNKVIGVGLFDPNSPIRIKMIHHGGGADVNSEFFLQKVKTAFDKRSTLLESNTNSYRLLFGENDGFPGLIADVYSNVLVVKLYSEIWWPFLGIIIEHLISISQSVTVVLRLSRKLQERTTLEVYDGQILYGDLENEVVQFIEHGVNFSANVIKGHKTGYFLDHRHNRKQVGELSHGKTVLDVFSYAGGFTVHALANGAEEVTSVDISGQALEMAKSNALLNNFTGIHKTLEGDAFEILKTLIKRKKTFDVVVIDPPSFAKQQTEIVMAKKKYRQLAKLGVRLCSKGGMLVLASCSSRIATQAFFDINKQVLIESGRPFETFLKTQHDSDHPIGFPEGAYLKCGFYSLD